MNKVEAFNQRNKIQINDADDFGCVCSDIFHEFLMTFTINNGLIRTIEEDEIEMFPESAEFTYTYKGIRLAETMLRRLYKVGEKYFPGEDVEIDSVLYREE